jgi:hypothetical protein
MTPYGLWLGAPGVVVDVFLAWLNYGIVPMVIADWQRTSVIQAAGPLSLVQLLVTTRPLLEGTGYLGC